MSVAQSGLFARIRTTARKARIPAFYVVTAGFLGFLVLALHEPIQFGYGAWTPGYEHFTHRVHHVMLGTFLGLLVASVAVQLYRPKQRVGAYLFAAIGIGTLTVVTLAEGVAAAAELIIFIIPLILLGLLHPGIRAGRPSRERLAKPMLVLAVAGAIPLAGFAALQVNLHLTAVDDHVIFGHYLFMAVGSLTIGLGAIVASFRPTGWRFLAYGVTGLLTLVGIASMVFAGAAQGTNFGIVGGALAIVWAVAFVGLAEYQSAQKEGSTGGWIAASDEEGDR